MEVQYDGANALAAAANGDFPLLVLLWGMAMAAPADLLALADAAGNTLLHHAAAGAGDEPDALHFLLQQAQAAGRALAPLVDARNAAQETPLLRAAAVGNLRLEAALLHAGGADLRARDAAGNSAAHHAAARGHLGALHLLLESEKQLHQGDGKHGTLGGRCHAKRDALYYAVLNEHKAVVQYLLQRGFDPNQPDADGKTSLDLAQTKDAPWLVDLLSGETSASQTAPSTFRETRASVALLYGGLLFTILSTSYFFPWWLAVPLIGFVLAKSLGAFRHRGGGHSHGAPGKSIEALHPSKRDVVVPATVSLSSSQPGKSLLNPPAAASSPSRLTLASLLKPQPEMAMGIWISWVSLFTLFYVVLWVDADYSEIARKYVGLLIVALVLEVVLLALWMRLAFVRPSDPGAISTYHEDVEKILADAAQGIPLNPATHCRTCLVAKPIRSKHCSKCGVCIARLDHHCTWINRCVGYGNHRLFVVFLLIHTVVLFVYVTLSMVVTIEKIQDLYELRVARATGNSTSVPDMTSMDVWVEVPSFISGYFLVLMVLVWAVLALGALGLMTKQHVANIGKNLTVNEEINWRRYEYLTKKTLGPASKSAVVVFANPFDRGVKKNYKEFFSRSGASALDYRSVFAVPTTQGAATVPETHRAESKDVHFEGVVQVV